MKPTLLLAAHLWAGLGACAVSLEQVGELPKGWKQLDKTVDLSMPIQLSIALRQANVHTLSSKIISGSDHLSVEDIRALRAPDQQDVDSVMQWLTENEITDATPKDDWIHFQTTAGKAELLLGMKLKAYTFLDSKPVLRTKEYFVPDSLSQAIDFVSPITNFMIPKKEGRMPLSLPPTQQKFSQESRQDDTAFCANQPTPDCIHKLYNIPYSTFDSSPIRFAIAGFLDQYANFKDTEQFLETMAPAVLKSGHNFSVEAINNGLNLQDQSKVGIEATFDVQYALALGYPTNVTFYTTGGRGVQLNNTGVLVPEQDSFNEPYLEFLQYLLEKPDNEVPHVISISYGDDEISVPRPYAERVCNMFGLLTARGTTIVVGSGDGGSEGMQGTHCLTIDGSHREITIATFPAVCPWVTSVGAVWHDTEPPVAANFSGGGFSQYFPRPSWQDGAIESYVRELNGHLQGYYDSSRRAIPDLAVVGTDFFMIFQSAPGPFYGTSASTPVIASMIALVNDARVRQGKNVLGWLNELLYSDKVRDVLQDITQGQSYSCTFPGNYTPGGWPATKGWDAVTGLGVPKQFDKLLQVLVEA